MELQTLTGIESAPLQFRLRSNQLSYSIDNPEDMSSGLSMATESVYIARQLASVAQLELVRCQFDSCQWCRVTK
jgi:hypothetical protein